MKLNLQIDRIELIGLDFSPDQCHQLKTCLENELVRIATGNEISSDFAKSTEILRITAKNIQLKNNGDPIQIGQKVSESLYGGIFHE